MPTNIVTPQSVETAQAVCSAANTALGDTPSANVQQILVAGAEGGVLYALTAIPRATVTATRCDLFSSTDGGTTKRLIRSKLMSAHTVAADTEIPTTSFPYTETAPRRLKPGEILYVGTAVALAAGIVFDAQYEDL